MIKICDCSNSSERPEHRHNSGGPKENDIMSDLKKYSSLYGCVYVSDVKDADILITNDIFPSDLIRLKIPKIKRMDGIYWDTNFVDRNYKLNMSAQVADHVIFISEFSKKSLKDLYPEVKLKRSSIILNNCDDTIFSKRNKSKELSFMASCTNWTRPEKRFDKLIEFAKNIEEKLFLMGTCEQVLPKNVIKLGYFDDYKLMSIAYQKASAFVNLSYRDAAPKTVCQALVTGLPVLYADSGGVPELVGDNGVKIKDEKNIYFSDKPYDLDMNDIMSSYQIFKDNFEEYKDRVLYTTYDYQLTISKYFEIIKGCLR